MGVNRIGMKEDGDYGSEMCTYLNIGGVKDGNLKESEKVD